MRNPHKPDQVMLTEGHHRLVSAAAIDLDMPIPVFDEGTQHAYSTVLGRFKNYDNSRSTEDEHLKTFIADPSIMQKNIKDSRGLVKPGDEYRKINEIQKTVKKYALDEENIKPAEKGYWK